MKITCKSISLVLLVVLADILSTSADMKIVSPGTYPLRGTLTSNDIGPLSQNNPHGFLDLLLEMLLCK